MDFSYVLTPFLAWFIAGISKFIINSLKAKQLAFGLIGYGGLPSNHSSIVCSISTLIALKEGISHPAFGVAVTLAFIVILDANSLRLQVGKQAEAINKILAGANKPILRERIGHTKLEIIAGIVVGIVVAQTIYFFQNYFLLFENKTY